MRENLFTSSSPASRTIEWRLSQPESTRLARRWPIRTRPPNFERTAFVLAGGGNRGAAQVGMLSALVEHDIYPDFVLGASVGALNGVAFASEPSRASLAKLYELWTSVSKDLIFPPHRFGNAWRYAQKRAFVYSNNSLEQIIRDNVAIADLADTQIPTEVVTTNAITGVALRISTGDPVAALLASAALPGALPQIEMDGVFYIDGGISDDVPILRAAELGATSIYVLYCGTIDRGARIRSRPIEAVLDSFVLAKLARLRADLKALGDGARVTILQSPIAQSIAWLDFGHGPEMIDDGYRSASSTLSQLEAPMAKPRRFGSARKAADFVEIRLEAPA